MKLLTTTQVAEQCAVSVDKVLFWITSKQLLAINLTERVGRQARWRIRQSDLDAFLERRSSVKAATPVERRSAARMVIPRIVKVS